MENSAPQSTERKRQLRWLAVYCIVGGLYACAFICFEHPPFQDYPNHLLEAMVIHSPADFSSCYTVEWRPAPNLLSHVFMALLVNLMPVDVAGRVFYVIVVLFASISLWLFCTSLGKSEFAKGLFLFTWLSAIPFWRGAMNFTFGYALWLCAVAVTHRIEQKNKRVMAVVDGLIAVPLYFTHLFPWALYTLFRLIRALLRKEKSLRYYVFLCVPTAIPVILFALSAGGDKPQIRFGTLGWKIAALKRVIGMPYATYIHSQFLFDSINAYNLVIYCVWVACLVLIVRLLASNRRKEVLLDPIFLPLVAFGVLYLAVPSQISIYSADLDQRLLHFVTLSIAVVGLNCMPKLPLKYAYLVNAILVATALSGAILTLGQFQSCQPDINTAIRSLCSQHVPGSSEPLPILTNNRLPEYARRSVIYAALKKVKLYTSLTQTSTAELHLDSHCYYAGGCPPRLFVTSVVRRIE